MQAPHLVQPEMLFLFLIFFFNLAAVQFSVYFLPAGLLFPSATVGRALSCGSYTGCYHVLTPMSLLQDLSLS